MGYFPVSFIAAFAASIPIVIPIFQFGVIFRLWDKYNQPVNRDLCICSCWDTVFKGGYETGHAEYKHFYFNCNRNTAIIWTITVLALIGLYEGIKSICKAIYQGYARPRMVMLFIAAIYPHYYAWWAYVNYYNDDFYKQFWHQLFFTLTELLSTFTVFSLISKEHLVSARKILIIISVATLHILASGWDQFVENVLKQEGELHQVMRDIGFMLPDILHILLPWFELKQMAKERRGIKFPPSHLIATNDFIIATVSVLSLWLICAFIKS